MKQPHIFRNGMDKPTIITAQQYGTKVSVELDHSDADLDELMDAFETLVIGLGYHADSWKSWIVERAAEYHEEENEKWEDREELENDFFGNYEDYKGQFEDWKNETPDEDEFDDYGMRITPNKVLIDAKKQYDEQIKNDKKKKKSK
jgi:phage anti-repressor protein